MQHYIQHMVYPRANRFLCFGDFDIDSLKTSPQDEEFIELSKWNSGTILWNLSLSLIKVLKSNLNGS